MKLRMVRLLLCALMVAVHSAAYTAAAPPPALAATGQTPPTTSVPPARFGHSLVYDRPAGRVLLFGGFRSFERDRKPPALGATRALSDLWSLEWSHDGAAAWRRVTPFGPAPEPRGGHAAVWDPVRDRMLVVGGTSWHVRDEAAKPPFAELYLAPPALEVWELDPAVPAWTKIPLSGAVPGALAFHSAVWHPQMQRVVIYGGTAAQAGYKGEAVVGVDADAQAEPLPDALVLDPSTGHIEPWGSLRTPNPARDSHVMLYDDAGTRLWLFGGHAERGAHGCVAALIAGACAFGADNVLDDVWTWSGRLAQQHHHHHQQPSAHPAARAGHTAVWDDDRDRVLVYGGASRDPIAETHEIPGFPADPTVWAHDLPSGSWSQASATGVRPPPRALHAAVYVPLRGMLIFGGIASLPGDEVLSDTRLLDATGAWTQIGAAP